MKSSQLLLSILAPSVQATKVLLPLYVYPSWQGWWNNVYAAIATNPAVDFQVVLNPYNGPGGATAGYNSDWISAVAKINAYPNVQTFGYVHASYNARPAADVNQDTGYWAGWNDYAAANISVAGIFFDEVPNWSGARGAGDVAYMAGVTQYARDAFEHVDSFETIYNVGAKPSHLEYFDDDMADYVIVFEEYAANYKNSVLKNNVPAGQAEKSSILIHDFKPSKLADATVAKWLRAFDSADIGSANILDYDYDQANSAEKPADIGSVASILGSL